MPLQDRQLDFEDFSSGAEKLSAILKRTEVSSARHKLCMEYTMLPKNDLIRVCRAYVRYGTKMYGIRNYCR